VFSPDGRTLYTASYDGSVIAWDLDGARRLGQPFRYTSRTGSVSTWSDVSADGSLFALSPGPNRVTLWRSGTLSRLAVPLRGPVGKLLASASLTGTATLWNVARRTRVRDLPGAVAAYAVRFSPNGKLVAVGDSSGAVVLWDAVSGRRVGEPLVGHGGAVNSLEFDQHGRLVTASEDGKLRLWDVVTRKLIGAPLPGSTTSGSVSFFPDG